MKLAALGVAIALLGRDFVYFDLLAFLIAHFGIGTPPRFVLNIQGILLVTVAIGLSYDPPTSGDGTTNGKLRLWS